MPGSSVSYPLTAEVRDRVKKVLNARKRELDLSYDEIAKESTLAVGTLHQFAGGYNTTTNDGKGRNVSLWVLLGLARGLRLPEDTLCAAAHATPSALERVAARHTLDERRRRKVYRHVVPGMSMPGVATPPSPAPEPPAPVANLRERLDLQRVNRLSHDVAKLPASVQLDLIGLVDDLLVEHDAP